MLKTKQLLELRVILFLFFVFALILNSNAQKISARLLDIENKESIPFATIQFSKNNAVMSNEEGDFEFEKPEKSKANDSIEIFCLGFETKRIASHGAIPKTIYLKTKVFKIAPVVLSNNKMSAIEIIDLVKKKLVRNYLSNYTKTQVFIRETHKQHFKKFDFDLNKSTIENINQNLFDTIINKVPNNFTSVMESYGDAYLYDTSEGKIQLKKLMIIRSKHQKASLKGLQDDFMRTLEENIKPDSYLIIKTGILRLDKTESIDSMLVKNKKGSKEDKRRTQVHRNGILNNQIKNLFLTDNTPVDFLSNSRRYNFDKIGYVEIDDALAYVIEFTPRGSSKYKGILYIHTEDFAILKSEIQGAKKVFDKHMNIFGIKANDLTYKNTVLFKKENDDKYHIKYMKTESTQEAGINRPFKMIEKNRHVRGRNKQNEVSLQMTISIYSQNKKEIVFNHPQSILKATYKDFKPNIDFEIGRFNSYNKQFWSGYNILTPEKAIQELKIED